MQRDEIVDPEFVACAMPPQKHSQLQRSNLQNELKSGHLMSSHRRRDDLEEEISYFLRKSCRSFKFKQVIILAY